MHICIYLYIYIYVSLCFRRTRIAKTKLMLQVTSDAAHRKARTHGRFCGTSLFHLFFSPIRLYPHRSVIYKQRNNRDELLFPVPHLFLRSCRSSCSHTSCRRLSPPLTAMHPNPSPQK